MVSESSNHGRYVTIKRASELTGYTSKAIRRKIEDGKWLEDQLWKKAPDGHILIDMDGYYKWVRGEPIAA